MATIIDFNQLQNKKILIIFPHPDDETVMAGGLILQAIKVGAHVKVVCLTSGERGRIHTSGWGKSLSEIRAAEFHRAVARLGVVDREIFSFPDGHLRNSSGWQKKINADFVSSFDLVLSYDLSGVTGHPDHIALTRHLHHLVRQTKLPLWEVSPTWPIKDLLLDHRVAPYLIPPEIIIRLSLRQRLRKWWAFATYASQYSFSTRLFALLFSLAPQSEDFSIFHPTHRYRFKFIPFNF